MAKAKLQCRIRYDENYRDTGKEYYVFETKWTTEEEWGLDTAFPVKDDMISYQALTRVRETMKLGIEIIWR